MPSRSSATVAALVAAVTIYAGIHWGATVAGGADSYGYVSQAGLWRQGQLHVSEDIARPSPWPGAIETWAPLGYRPAPGRRDAIVPLYPPGLPIVMAIAQAIGGFCAAFVIVPLCGGLTVYLTYALGRRVFAQAGIALGAAVLVATSPVFLYQLMNPMTDVPVTASWSLATLLALAGQPFAAGIGAAMAILIRPNLVPLAAVLAGWLMLRNGSTPGGTVRRLVAFGAPVVAAAAAIAIVNARLYGVPWESGYGTPGDLFAFAYLSRNVSQFSRWLLETQTPLVLLAVAPLAARRGVDDRADAHPRWLLAAMIVAVIACYALYLPFDAWWYLRFLLPMWPMMMILVAASPAALLRRTNTATIVLGVLVVGLAAFGVKTAAARSAFDLGRGERRYVEIARFFHDHTEPGAVAIALQHSGTIRLYGDRLTLRYDQLDPLWLDRVVAFLRENGRHPYVVVDGGEVEAFRRSFGSANAVGRLDWRPLAAMDEPRVAIYDAVERDSTNEPIAISAAALRRTGWRCDAPYVWPPPLRIR